jgi:kumamolisin
MDFQFERTVIMAPIRPYIRRRTLGALASAHQASYTPDQVAALYSFPKVTTGSDPTIAIIELGGGYSKTDVAAYFQKLNLPAPNIIEYTVAGGANSPGVDPNADSEVMLDILVAAAAYASSAGKPANILVIFAGNTNTGFADAINAAATHSSRPAVCSISWGGPENQWDKTSINAMEAAFLAAKTAKMTVLVAAGDNGSSDGEAGVHVDYPASSALVIGCGGTTLRASGNTIISETTWNDGTQGGATGGGYSAVFGRPNWQSFKHMARGVPDVAGNADPYTGYVIIVDGKTQVVGGTSAVAPLFSALVALLVKKSGSPLGFLNNQWYEKPNDFRDITTGNNGAFKAGLGWNPTTGLGVPIGIDL